MANEPASGASQAEPETTVDRFEHEIEDLEVPMGKGVRQWVIGLMAAGVLVLVFFLGATIMSRQSPEPQGGALTITPIETQEPRRSQLTEKPKMFRWESLSRASRYLVRIQEAGGTTDLIVRETTNNWIELTSEEQSRLVRGGRYTWSVRARSSDGWSIGNGESAFNL